MDLITCAVTEAGDGFKRNPNVHITLDEIAAVRIAEVHNTSLGPMIEPDEIAELAWFGVSPAARSISRQ